MIVAVIFLKDGTLCEKKSAFLLTDEQKMLFVCF